MRAEIEDLHAIDNYGLSEIIGPGVSCECIESKNGPHIWEDHFYPEVDDPATGKVLPDGEVGELVFTTLTKEAAPVRFRTRDLSRLLPGTARSMRRMGKVTGRFDDMMIVRGVNLFPSQIEETILKDERLAPHFVIELRRVERLDEITVVVEARPDADNSLPHATAISPITSRRRLEWPQRCARSKLERLSARLARPGASSICVSNPSGAVRSIPAASPIASCAYAP